jgi:hypothetical protein
LNASVSVAELETLAADENQAPSRPRWKVLLCAREEQERGRCHARRLHFVRGERLTPELGDARLRARQEERDA